MTPDRLAEQIRANALFSYHVTLDTCFLKVPDSDRAMKSELITEKDPTAWKGDVWGWRK